MFDISLLKKCPDDIIYQILDQNFLGVSDIYNFLFNRSTHYVAQQVLNKRSLIHLTIGSRKNYESVITSSHDYEITKGPYYWHIYYNYTNKDSFLSWYDRHKLINNYVIQIFLDQFQFDSLEFFQILKYKNIKIYLNYENDDNHTVRKFTHIIWPMIEDIFDFQLNSINLILEYESSIDQDLSIDIANIKEFEFRHYTPTYRQVEFKLNQQLNKLIINNISMLPLTIKLSSLPSSSLLPINLCSFFIKGPVANLNYLGKILQQCHNLQYLTISKGYMKNFKDFIKIVSPLGLSRLKTLDLSYNDFGSIESIDLSIYFPNLINFILKFEGLKSRKFHFTNIIFPNSLKCLMLQDKGIATFKDIQGLQYLKILDLSYNYPLHFQIPHTVEHIQLLNLSYNRTILSSIYRFNRLDISRFIFFKVSELHLQGCNICNEDLEELELEYEDKPIPKSQVKFLDLSNNKLSNLRMFSGKLFMNMPLEFVDLSFNGFDYLNDHNFPLIKNNYPVLKKINLTGNSRLRKITGIDQYPQLETAFTQFDRKGCI
ncbi:uncharacterized protein J8A68_004261 [[Candida] subhashii]|uniref:Leucine rich repeat protein n=1 Tax=[Candida] subhashii TaxID=561895 RepID=A0A8J5UKR9_9ASCO|nr:uncharacterized protein J8A68_004261 [[Candida] subhashii]KAG7662251.1 hypothetical protein J8A68_004261 [[Candida] subhashii]